MEDDNHDKVLNKTIGQTKEGTFSTAKESRGGSKMRSLASRTTLTQQNGAGLHDGYEEGVRPKKHSHRNETTKPVGQGRKAFEQNFILSTLKGVANALKSSHRNSLKQSLSNTEQSRRPTSAISSASTPSTSSSDSSSTSSFVVASTTLKSHRHSTGPANGVDLELASNCSTSSSVSSNLSSSNMIGSSDCYQTNNNTTGSGETDGKSHHQHNYHHHAGRRSIGSNNASNVTISSDHLNLLESMKFDSTSDIESIKKDLIKICRENRLEILAHYVSQIG